MRSGRRHVEAANCRAKGLSDRRKRRVPIEATHAVTHNAGEVRSGRLLANLRGSGLARRGEAAEVRIATLTRQAVTKVAGQGRLSTPGRPTGLTATTVCLAEGRGSRAVGRQGRRPGNLVGTCVVGAAGEGGNGPRSGRFRLTAIATHLVSTEREKRFAFRGRRSGCSSEKGNKNGASQDWRLKRSSKKEFGSRACSRREGPSGRASGRSCCRRTASTRRMGTPSRASSASGRYCRRRSPAKVVSS